MAAAMIPQPDIRPVAESGPEYRVFQPYPVSVGVRGNVYNFVVPAGFITDGASVPRALWSLLNMPPDGIYRPAALAHDYLYTMHAIKGALGFNYDRLLADQAFRVLLKACGVMEWHVGTAYAAVRSFGWLYWNKHNNP